MQVQDRSKKELADRLENLERKIRELEGQESPGWNYRLLLSMIKNSSDAITVLDLAGNIMAWNRGAEEIYGYKESEALQMNVLDLIPGEGKKEFSGLLQRITAGEDIKSLETKRLTKDGRRIDVWLTFSSIKNEQGQVTAIGTTQRDITKRKRMEEELIKKNEELRNSNLQLERFTAVVSHDLQSPLLSVLASMKLLEKHTKKYASPEDSRLIEDLRQRCLDMLELIRKLLEYSRLSSIQREFKPVDMKKALEKSLSNLKPEIEQGGAKIGYNGLPAVKGDEVLLVELFQNLIGNAIKFRSERPLEIEVRGEDNKTEWLFSVKDNGIGIPSAEIPNLFNIFYQIQRGKYPGAGIGLSTSKKILEHHGGRIWVESVPGKGSTFFFTIPKMPSKRHINNMSLVK